jgi:D-proline reductase (dithiol) PrdB
MGADWRGFEGGTAMDDPGQPVGYMERTRLYYRALGYKADYQWAHHDAVPFVRLAKPLAACRIALLTTASPLDGSNKDAKNWRHPWSAPIDPAPASLDTSDLAWDRESTHTDDRESFLPLAAAGAWAAEGRIAGLTGRFHGVPTEYSIRKTNAQDAPDVLARLREDGADAAILCAI